MRSRNRALALSLAISAAAPALAAQWDATPWSGGSVLWSESFVVYPSAAGRTSYASNVSYYRGEVGVSAGLMHRLEGDFAVSAGVSYAGGRNTAVRAGVAGEF